MRLFGSSLPPPHSEVRSKSYRVFRPRQWASLERGAGCPRWVETGKALGEHMFSALTPKADSTRTSRHVRKVPLAEVIRSSSPRATTLAVMIIRATRLAAILLHIARGL